MDLLELQHVHFHILTKEGDDDYPVVYRYYEVASKLKAPIQICSRERCIVERVFNYRKSFT